MTKKIVTLALAVFGLSLMSVGASYAGECTGQPNGTVCSVGVCNAGKCMAVSKEDLLNVQFELQTDQLARDTGKPKCNGTCVMRLNEASTCNGRPFSDYSSVKCTNTIYE